MYESITNEMAKIPEYDYEIIFADNDSKDSSQMILKDIASKDKKVKVIINQRNFGPQRSGVNIMRNASGDAYICIPCDFQEPPSMIPGFIEEWEKGYDIVWGQKSKSKENFIKFICRKIYYYIIKILSDTPQMEQVIGFGIMDKKVIDVLQLTQLQDPNYSTRHLVSEYGFNIKLVPYTQNKRERGRSSYNIISYFQFAINSLCNTTVKPLHIITLLGFSGGFISILIALVYFVYKIIYWNSFSLGIAPVVIGLFFVSSIQLFSIGMLGEYIAIIVRRITQKPLVIEKEKINFENK
jgi:glycosyltransferase involved in cell wall biosynthesis